MNRNNKERKKIIVGLSGASGAIYCIKLLEALKSLDIEIHFVASQGGLEVLYYEMNIKKEDIKEMADYIYDVNKIGSTIASGSFICDGMVIVPCSMKTLGSLASGIGDNLLTRAADVQLKEGRPLILVPRETPIHAIHLENMLKLAKLGVKILPASPGFYHGPQNIDELVMQVVGKICDNLNIDNNLYPRWQG